VEEVFVIGALVHILLVLELVGCVNGNEPRVLTAPDKIFRDMMSSRKVFATSPIHAYFQLFIN
jgi:hypothetical protein